ncbi:MAG: ATP-binding protein [Terriglobales bacterium]
MDFPKPRILVVDDEPNVLLTVEAILQMEGYEVTSAANGAEAIGAIRQRHFDLVLTDLKMPGIDGLGVLAEVSKRSPDTVTVMMTGFGSVGSALEAVQLGAYEYLLKPTEVADLKAAVRRSLERKRLSEIDTLYRVGRELAHTADPRAIRRAVNDAVCRVLGVADACLIEFDRESGSPDCAESPSHAVVEPAVLAALKRGSIVDSDSLIGEARRWAEESGVVSCVFVPGRTGDRLVCAICAHNGAQHYDFHASAQRFLQGVASQAALALDNASLITELERNNRELSAANRKLQELDKLKSQFLSVATHELRTPLSMILGYNSMLEESLGPRLSLDENETLRESIAACRRLIRLVNSMLDITQIESGHMKMNFSYGDLRQVASSVVSLFQHEARKKGIKLGLEIPARLPRVLLDPERIEQVLINLVANALKFTREGSVIVAVRTRSDTHNIEVSVRDTGIGIAPEDQERIFDEFSQIRAHMQNPQREGSGLGLAIAKRIIEAHEGGICVSSTPGQGSTFVFSIPLKSRAPSASASVFA